MCSRKGRQDGQNNPTFKANRDSDGIGCRSSTESWKTPLLRPPSRKWASACLIQANYFVGHKYRFHEGGYAIVGGKTIEVFDKDGKLLRTVSLEESGEQAA